jgi:cysteinyl-tRNA synthetase
MKLSLYNTLTRKTEVFQPLNEKSIRMYVCGPTVYDRPHIGNARSCVVYDLLYRVLRYIYDADNVTYVRNITDIDDKIINRAAEKNIPLKQLTTETTSYFHSDMDYLGVLRPDIEPRATEHLAQMIEMIERLVEKGIAYQSDGHVFFDVRKVQQYNLLSGRSIDQLMHGSRIELSTIKNNPEDFVLWKPAKDGEPESANFNSPFGLGRPGWHIECSAMSYQYLGPDFDIHGGGADLIFPHHTNEIAQSCAANGGSKYAKYWVHNGFLSVNGQKMSKSLGNFVTVQDLQNKGLKGDTLRLFLLSNHYRKPLDYNALAIENVEKMLAYWRRAIEHSGITTLQDENLPEDFCLALMDDLNMSIAFRCLNDYSSTIFSSNISSEILTSAKKLFVCLRFLNVATKEQVVELSENEVRQIESIVAARTLAKNEKNWQLADECRARLEAMGVTVEDRDDGTSLWKKK